MLSRSALLRSSLPRALRSAPMATTRVAVRPQTSPSPRRAPKENMFCFQCEQTRNAEACVVRGVCGKTPEVAHLQDMLVYCLKALSQWLTVASSHLGMDFPRESFHVQEAMFATLTNVNFDPARIQSFVKETIALRDQVRKQYEAECAKRGESPQAPLSLAMAEFTPKNASDVEALSQEGSQVGVLFHRSKHGEDIAGVHEMVMYGLKGLCAYATHAHMLGKDSAEVHRFIAESLAWLDSEQAGDLNASLGKALEVGKANVTVLQLLDEGHTQSFGNPVPTEVNMSPVAGKCLLVSGHDLRDLHELLEATKGTGINVYTHGEMLPAHGYPGLKKYEHLKGHYGGAWNLQKFEFAHFPGPILMTTNCLIEPRDSYRDRIFTIGAVGWPGVEHLETRNFSRLIEIAQSMDGFEKTEEPNMVTTGFGHATVLGIADKVIDAVTQGHIKRLHVIGGCDGSEGERSYFTDLAKGLPMDHVVLTLGCGKYRINKLPMGTVPNTGLPRLLDMGQCNDAYSAVVVANALAKHFDTDLNGLPLDVTLSWFEQKAVAVLLSLLHLNVQNITIGPRLPAFITPNVLAALVEKFGLRPIPAKA